MVTDAFNLFSDTVDIAALASPSASFSVMPFIGQGAPVNITVSSPVAFNNGTLAVIVQGSTDNITFTDVATLNMGLMADLKTQAGIGSFTIPQEFKKGYIRLKYTVTGTAPTTGKLWAGVTLEHFAPYQSGMYIDKGKVVK